MDLIMVIFVTMLGAGIVILMAWGAVKGSSGQALTEKLGRKIVEVKLLGAGSSDYRSAGGALLGGMVAGPLGAVIGGTHGGSGKQKQRFAVKYSDGSVAIKEVRVNSREYNELMKHVDWDEIR